MTGARDIGIIVVTAPAKINLTLDVLGRRADGYHALRSVMQTLELHDTIEIRPSDALSCCCDDDALAGEGNLALRAARALRAVTGHGGADVYVRKSVPVGAGLGGGSSDAAVTLVALNNLWATGLSGVELASIGATVGSDVPFFLHAPTALVEGRGEVVQALPPLPLAHVVLLKPPTAIATGTVFAALTPRDYGDGSATDRLLEALREGRPPDLWPLRNDLQNTVAALYPEVAGALTQLREAGARQPLLTGSGSTVYALFGSAAEARAVHARLTARGLPALLTRTRRSSQGGPATAVAW